MKKNWLRFILLRRGAVVLLLILQLIVLSYIITGTGASSDVIDELFSILSVLVVCFVITNEESAEYKIMWTVILFALPLFGGVMYLILSLQADSRKFMEKWRKSNARRFAALKNISVENELKQNEPESSSVVNYLCEHIGYEAYKNTCISYYKCGEDSLDDICDALCGAQKYIFLEFFIIQEGVMWNRILEILKQKAACGVDVRVVYDDIGCLLRIPKEYDSILRSYGIKCCTFNRLRPILSSVQNNRDHRKIISVDGKTAFIGGMNIADEYINEITLYGYWKDSIFKIYGDAAVGFTRSFLAMWDWLSGEEVDFESFAPQYDGHAVKNSSGYVIPFDESPFDQERTAEDLYLNIINRARRNVYIYTPYLMVDDVMRNALTFAAKSGIDVKIITPHIADKKVVHATTRSFYGSLINSGVKIYEFTPGFMHSKLIVSDGKYGVVGSINMDFRSFNLHFECGAWICDENLISQVERDFESTVEVSEQVTEEKNKKFVLTRVIQSFLRLLSPLM